MGDIVWVPFPFVEMPRLRERPALVVGLPQEQKGHGLVWVLMITSAANAGWPGDVSLQERFAECGLSVSCVIRTAKIATVDARQRRVSGELPADILAEVRRQLACTLAATPE